MVFDGFGDGSPATESSCRKENALDGIVDQNGNKGRIVRSGRVEVIKCVVSGDQEKISGDDGYVKKRRSDGRSHGSISVIGRRREMEDAVTVRLGFLKKGLKSYDFYGVYDGHGGAVVARACHERLHGLLAGVVGEEGGDEEIDWGKVMAAGFRKMDEEVDMIGGAAVETVGSTAVVAVVGEEEVAVANCGDSRAVISQGGVAIQLSDDHKPDRADELERIEACGGKVINWNGPRVLGVLATSRSIGDNYLKPFVTSTPEVRVFNRTKMDEFLILASDGLWDVISNDLACQIARRCLDGRLRRRLQDRANIGNVGGVKKTIEKGRAAEAATMLAELAIARGSKDNISVIVVELQKNKKYSASGCVNGIR